MADLPDPNNPQPGDILDFGSGQNGPLRGRVFRAYGIQWLDGPKAGLYQYLPGSWIARYGRVPDIDVAVAAFADEIPDYFDAPDDQ